jgi:hypothetical protein
MDPNRDDENSAKRSLNDSESQRTEVSGGGQKKAKTQSNHHNPQHTLVASMQRMSSGKM